MNTQKSGQISDLQVRVLGMQDYEPVWKKMQEFTASRTPDTTDEIWLLEHPKVFTQGMNSKPEHLLEPGTIPVVQIDRGGQITYHGPGQLVVYLLLDLKRLDLGVRQLVTLLEQSVIDLLAEYDIPAIVHKDAPGVYVQGNCKIAALGLRIKKGCSYHGLSLNVDMDLSPFKQINPCGFPGLAVTQLKDLGINLGVEEAGEHLIKHLRTHLGYTTP
ncbi:MAG: lipoyl(octanoyl) transferase LipB [Gammaproteobacteria bacterium]|nr:lipoyl(octanoyl) transferase LipB [Gammaproteobacteria bacterium]